MASSKFYDSNRTSCRCKVKEKFNLMLEEIERCLLNVQNLKCSKVRKALVNELDSDQIGSSLINSGETDVVLTDLFFWWNSPQLPRFLANLQDMCESDLSPDDTEEISQLVERAESFRNVLKEFIFHCAHCLADGIALILTDEEWPSDETNYTKYGLVAIAKEVAKEKFNLDVVPKFTSTSPMSNAHGILSSPPPLQDPISESEMHVKQTYPDCFDYDYVEESQVGMPSSLKPFLMEQSYEIPRFHTEQMKFLIETNTLPLSFPEERSFSSPTQESVQHTSLKEVQASFNELFAKVTAQLKTKRVSVNKVLAELKGVDYSIESQNDCGVEELLHSLRDHNIHCSFMDYGYLEVIIDKFVPECQQELKQYEEMPLKPFCRTRIMNNNNSLVFKLDRELEDFKFGDIRRVTQKLAAILRVDSSDLHVSSVRRGCVEFSCAIPSRVAETISHWAITRSDKISLQEEKALSLKCNGTTLYENMESLQQHVRKYKSPQVSTTATTAQNNVQGVRQPLDSESGSASRKKTQVSAHQDGTANSQKSTPPLQCMKNTSISSQWPLERRYITCNPFQPAAPIAMSMWIAAKYGHERGQWLPIFCDSDQMCDGNKGTPYSCQRLTMMFRVLHDTWAPD